MPAATVGNTQTSPGSKNDYIRATMSVGNILSSPLLAARSSPPASTRSGLGDDIETGSEAASMFSDHADMSPQPGNTSDEKVKTSDADMNVRDTAATASARSTSAEEDASTTSTGNASSGPTTTAAQCIREFVCMNDEYSDCQTGQVTLALSRKVISNHFGRNKGCTRLITDWPLFCRKHYQRATYKPDLWQRRKVALIARQVDKIEEQHPGTTYDITLKKSEEKRLNEFARKVSCGMSVENASNVFTPDDTLKAFQAPIEVLRHLEPYIGVDKPKEEVKEVIALILDMLKNGETKEVPSIEFLPFFPGSRKVKLKVKAKPTATSKSPTTRISTRGSIKKPSKD